MISEQKQSYRIFFGKRQKTHRENAIALCTFLQYLRKGQCMYGYGEY